MFLCILFRSDDMIEMNTVLNKSKGSEKTIDRIKFRNPHKDMNFDSNQLRKDY